MRVRISAVCSLLVVIVAGCCWGQSQQAHAQQVPAQQKSELKIGFSIEATYGERWQTDLEQFETRAQQLGAKTITRSADGDDDKQFKQVKELLDSGIDALVLLPHDSAKAIRIVEAAHARHVPVISY